ncbi:Extracellular metalloprotease [Colletotrichum sidae]|uniref:Extracellular metalloprotease n=4 Tax=Colletotrichum orbiculare species complex TaxID=2707354 RepID=N4VHH7_COLOR|nr:Extracellular metalloprotease [Colletotrichum orbiculare MAFF 240422]TDZ39576.1 Extracellular metalloprotease [Colletotrichum spinosum]TDZ67397.1 Extracellular metalloprotease [Colletotrichum trifolii]TEA03252.1 Extracellular metalloprotease [Colletotrichum sidae]
MQAKLTLVAALAAIASAAVAPVGRFGCATEEPSAEHLEISKKLAEEEAANAGNFTLLATINVPTYFHVVASSQTVANGWVTDRQLADQLAVMNADFAPHGIAFNLVETTRTVNPTWAQDGNELAMKRALRKGDYGALNLYFLRSLGGAFGYCYFPTTAAAGSTAFIRDGCSILSSTVPGGSTTNYNLGKTVTHEVGHWFGLYHTFQGGCTGSGDYVSDTPAQASSTSGCPIGRDSCPSQAGLDPIHNYMDYSVDSCYEEFTSGQQTRMYSYFNQYRA